MGEFEHLVLLAILRVGDNAYGVPIANVVEERTGREVSHAAVYLTLRRLEEKGWIESELGDPTPSRGGRAKRYFRICSDGLARLREARLELGSMWDGLGAEFDG